MLTESEKDWYNLRPQNGTAFCYHCQNWGGDCSLQSTCPFNVDWQDAAEFEARVAAKLAENAYRKVVLVEGDISDFGLLKWARLQVEEEMENG